MKIKYKELTIKTDGMKIQIFADDQIIGFLDNFKLEASEQGISISCTK